ncbi:VOC family protein [Anaerotruncus rubiinfantis]|uniref:VOC family protein n=1 Tax=Anaerotruncus rubiinfantis TaxID=1720200 RepID=UPI0034A29371
MKFEGPLLAVRDLAASRSFYETLLGQKLCYDFGANISFESGLSLQTLESWAGFLKKPAEEIRLGGNDAELYFEPDDFDGFLIRLEESGAALVHPVTEYDWGQRVVRFYDPDRHIVEVGQSMKSVALHFWREGMPLAKVVERTQHPDAVVRGWIAEELSPCGVDCAGCGQYPAECPGCNAIEGKVYWARYIGQEACPEYTCPVNEKGLRSCGECRELPCRQFYEMQDPSVSDEQHQKEIEERVARLRDLFPQK